MNLKMLSGGKTSPLNMKQNFNFFSFQTAKKFLIDLKTFDNVMNSKKKSCKKQFPFINSFVSLSYPENNLKSRVFNKTIN